jgi:hypothetical protein
MDARVRPCPLRIRLSEPITDNKIFIRMNLAIYNFAATGLFKLVNLFLKTFQKAKGVHFKGAEIQIVQKS